jgi:hypothetical protein
MRIRTRIALAVIVSATVAGAVFAAPGAGRTLQEAFPHQEHANLFPLCTTCHTGIVEQGQPVYPAPAACASCHDGVVEQRIEWTPPAAGSRSGNLRFTHAVHTREALEERPADSTQIRACGSCHNESGAPRMAVQHAVVGQCLDCHRLEPPHVDVPSTACATCHVRLTDASGLTREDIAAFPKPASHDDPGFLLGGHGKAAKGPGAAGPTAISASCATCHARNLCLTCHVNAPESPVIQALALDPRSPVYTASLPVPPSHAEAGFLRSHGRLAQRGAASCASCHTRQSCTTCHVGSAPSTIAALPDAGPERAAGAHVTREAPPSHTWDFREHHGAEANARPQTCETCHTRSMCLECHRPEGARQAGYHPAGFLTRHPSAAYTREANCSDCHNTAQFCQSCHQQSGLVANSRLGQAGFHDAFRGFSLGHGQAARQSLESCAGCHAERDCTACHSAVAGGFRFNPHGPGFDAARLRSKNPSLCTACHGRAIPGVP